MPALLTALSAVIAYVLGSLNGAVMLTKFILHDDVRTHGSGNAGTANVARVFGAWVGFLTLVIDVLKMVAAIAIGRAIAGEWGFFAASVACSIGHCWPVFFNFKGGKGVAVAVGVGIMLDLWLLLICVAIWAIMLLIFRYASLSSITAVLSIPVFMLILGGFSTLELILGIFIALFVCFMHRENIARLIKGTERRFSFGKRK